VPTVDTKREIREFLTSRRARITPAQAGLRTYGNGPRRVPGLRREEVALLAGVSIAYYTKLERGDTSGVSETVLESLARALQLDDAERAHLFDLARAQSTTARPRRSRAPQRVRPGVERLLDSITAPAMVRNGRMDILATNPLGRALYSEMFAKPRTPVNSARFTFLDPRATSFFLDWDHAADDSVAVLRGEAGRNPNDRALSDLVGELSTQSEEFRHPLGQTRRPLPRHRQEAPPPPARRRSRTHLRRADARRRLRAHDVRLYRRAQHEIGGCAQPARELDGNPRSASSADRSRPLSDRRSAPARRLYEAIQAAVPDRTTQFAPGDIPAHSRRRDHYP
jgi:transcriptional regulator with XRE-family HTH domain